MDTGLDVLRQNRIEYFVNAWLERIQRSRGIGIGFRHRTGFRLFRKHELNG